MYYFSNYKVKFDLLGCFFFFFLPLCQYLLELDTELEINHTVSQDILMDTEVSTLENGSVGGFITDGMFLRADR